MIAPDKLLKYLRAACTDLLNSGVLGSNRLPLRPTQREALEAYAQFLDRGDLSVQQKLTGFFEIPTGVGKTALFGALVERAMHHAQRDGQNMRVGIIAPTISLLTQTRDHLMRSHPALADKIGVYGGREKNGDHPLNIVTYDSWASLTDRGEWGRGRFDLLIADEAHRGTSVAREQRLIEHYAGIGNLAFTATAHFDPFKTVENTHKNKIFEKHIAASVQDGELASYIEVQPYFLRISPDKATNDHSENHRLAKELTFNKFVRDILRSGQNNYTGNPLTDNQGAVFVARTAQANHLEKLLNNDPVLQARAQQRGAKAFATAIHTVGLSADEQLRREEDYTAGKYLFVVGDKKFKEGFDHPPLKTILDMPHGSMVDKAQILGRGTRQFGREGMVIADTIIYIGSDNPKLDEEARDRALVEAVSATDILDGAARVVWRHAPTRTKIPGPGGPGPNWDPDYSVTHIDSQEDIKRYVSRRQELTSKPEVIENWPESEDYRVMKELRQRKGGVGYKALFKAAEANPATQGLFSSRDVIKDLLNGSTKSAPVDQVKALMRLLEAQPDVSPRKMITNWPKSADYLFVQKLKQRKNAGAHKIFHAAEKDTTTQGMFSCANVIDNLLQGRIKNAPADKVKALIQLLKAQPDMRPDDKITNWPESSDSRIMQRVKQRKGVGSRILFKAALTDPSMQGLFLSHEVIKGLFNGDTKNAPVDQVNAIMRLLETFPDKKPIVSAKAACGKELARRRASDAPHNKKTPKPAVSHDETEETPELSRQPTRPTTETGKAHPRPKPIKTLRR